MEDVYTIKVKTKPDTRNLYPSERRYSASTVSGLAWVHFALAATCLLLACLALVHTNPGKETTLNVTDSIENRTASDASANEKTDADSNEEPHNGIFNIESNDSETNLNATEAKVNQTNLDAIKNDWNCILVIAPGLITIFGLAAGIASILASVKWYVDHNITWLFIMSCLSTLASLTSFVMIIIWFVTTTGGDITTDFYKEQVPFKDYFIVKHSDVIVKNESHMIIALNTPHEKEETPNLFTERVLSINILIAAILELLWSILSVKISYKGMRNNYKEDNERRGNCISVVTKIKGNDTTKLPRHGKIPRKDLIEHYPSKKIKRIFMAQSDNGFYLKNQQNKNKQNTETSSEFYKERMLNFLNRCASLEGISNPEMRTPSVQSEGVTNNLNPIPEVASVDINLEESNNESNKERMTPVSWGDTPDHTVYNQNTLNLENILSFKQNNAAKSDSSANNE